MAAVYSQPSILGRHKIPALAAQRCMGGPRSKVSGVPLEEQSEIDKGLQLAIRRARIGVEILKRPSDDQTKFDLFQRLNAGGTQANPQELRNCIILMINGQFYKAVKAAAEKEPAFQTVVAVTKDQIKPATAPGICREVTRADFRALRRRIGRRGIH